MAIENGLQQSGVAMQRHEYAETFDITGGKDSSGEPYTFSDGVGTLSLDFAKRIAQDMNLGKGVPSCFQVSLLSVKMFCLLSFRSVFVATRVC